MRIIFDLLNITLACVIIALILLEPRHIAVTINQPVQPTSFEQASSAFSAGLDRLSQSFDRTIRSAIR